MKHKTRPDASSYPKNINSSMKRSIELSLAPFLMKAPDRGTFRLLLLIFLISTIESPLLYGQWVEVNLPRYGIKYANLVGIEWPDSLTGYVFDIRGCYYKTTDGGFNWKRDSLNPMPYNDISHRPFNGLTVKYVDFRTSKFGLVSLECEWQGQRGLDSVIYITNDGGASWIKREILLDQPRCIGISNQSYSVIRALESYKWYLFYTRLLPTLKTGECVYFSSNQGKDWILTSIDTLGTDDYVSASWFVMVDSLHQYKFYNWDDGTEINCWAKMTTDGGVTWSRIRNLSHPLAEQYYQGFGFKKIRMVGDTGISITLAPDNEFPPGRYYGMTTTDLRYRDQKIGWTGFTLPWFATATVDIAYHDGITYAITRSSSAPFGEIDSTWIVNAATKTIKGIRSPMELVDIVASSRDMLWGRATGGLKIFRFDRHWLGFERINSRPANTSLKVFPNPASRSLHDSVVLEFEFDGYPTSGHIVVQDILGRTLRTIPIDSFEKGANRQKLLLDSFASNSASAPFLITFFTDRYTPFSTVLFLSK